MNHNVICWDTEPPSNMEMLVGMVRKTANEDSSGWLNTITIRMPVTLACFIDAMAKHSGQSRNKLMVKMLETSLDLVLEQLPESERDEIHDLCSQIIGEVMEKKAGESGSV